jgi:hypothetical protein
VSVTAKVLANTQYAPSGAESGVYTAPTATTTIIDKFTATNITGSAVTLTVKIVPLGQTSGIQHQILVSSVPANSTSDFSVLQNQILSHGDAILLLASTASALVIRASGREVT